MIFKTSSSLVPLTFHLDKISNPSGLISGQDSSQSYEIISALLSPPFDQQFQASLAPADTTGSQDHSAGPSYCTSSNTRFTISRKHQHGDEEIATT